MKIKLLLATFVLACISPAMAQISYAKAADFPDMQGRTLIVELLELDEDQIGDWKKKRDKTKKDDKKEEFQHKIDAYTNFVGAYNEAIRTAVSEYWSMNPEVIYKTTSEVDQLMKDKSEAFTVLWYSESDSNRRDDYGATYFPNLTVPTLNYSRIENGRRKTDYCYFLHYTHDRNDALRYSDLVLGLRLMKPHMKYIVANGKKKYTFNDYVKDVSEDNCKNLASQQLYIEEGSVHKKTSLSELNGSYSGQINSLTDDEISNAILNAEDRIIGFFFPYGIAVGSMGPASMGRIQFVRAFVNTKTGTIYTNFGGKTGQFYDAYFREREFEKYDECD